MKQERLQLHDIIGNRYEIVALLGEGGMSTVYLADDLRLPGKQWAVKQSRGQLADIPDVLAEAELLVRLDHPFLPKIVDFIPPDGTGTFFLVMDYIKGRTLQQLFEQQSLGIPLPLVVRYAVQLSELFDYLHHAFDEPIIYRDLKPSNIMIDESGNVRLIDFGIARRYKTGQSADTVQIGTIGFAAPEQFVSAQSDPRTDLYGLGALLYYLISGGQYFYVTRRPIEDLCPDIPGKAAQIIGKLLRDEPAERYQTARQLLEELAALRDELEDGRRPAPRSEIASSEPAVDKLIVFGGLYSGSGSTFTAVSVARELNNCRLPHAVIEHPAADPQLFHLMFGEQNAPPAYQFYPDILAGNDASPDWNEWSTGHTLWVPNRPSGCETWSPDDNFKLLHAVKRPVKLVDVADRWTHPAVKHLCRLADMVVCVLDTHPTRLHLPRTGQNLQALEQLKQAGKHVCFVVNKYVRHAAADRWIQSLPFPVAAKIPYIPYESVAMATWKGHAVQDDPRWKETCGRAVLPLVRDIAPHIYRSGRRRYTFWSRWFRRSV